MKPGRNWADLYANKNQRVDKRVGRPNGKGVPTIHSSKAAGMAVPPRGTPVNLSGTDRFTLQRPMVRYAGTGADSLSGFDIKGFIYTPSTRLRCQVNIYFEPDVNTNAEPLFNVQPTWTVTEMVINSSSGRQSALQQIYPASGDANLPDKFTIDNAGELVRANVHLDNSQFKQSYAGVAGFANLVLQASWEPNVYIHPDELRRLYERCRIDNGNVPNIRSITIP